MLGVFGDSFADATEYPVNGLVTPSWPSQIAKRLNLTLKNFSYSGTSPWYSFKNFRSNYKKFTHIIFVYSEQNRWQSLPDELKRFSSIYTKEKLDTFPTISNSQYKIMEKLVGLHKTLSNEQFNNYLLQEIFNNVNKICKENDIKLINVLPFIDNKRYKLNLDNRHGPCLLNLLSIAENEICVPCTLTGVKLKHKEFDFFIKNGDYRRNHINPVNNMLMTDILEEEFTKNENTVIDLFKEKNFNFDIEVLLEYKKQIESSLNGRK